MRSGVSSRMRPDPRVVGAGAVGGVRASGHGHVSAGVGSGGRSGGNAGFAIASTQCGPSQVSLGIANLPPPGRPAERFALIGFDPRRPPRPEAGIGRPDEQPRGRHISPSPSPPLSDARPVFVGFGLQINGLGAVADAALAAGAEPPREPQLFDDWVQWDSSDDSEARGDPEMFNYRDYRWQPQQLASASAPSRAVAQQCLGRKRMPRRALNPRGEDDMDGELPTPWGQDRQLCRWQQPPLSGGRPAASSRSPSPFAGDDTVEGQHLRRVAQAVASFYGISAESIIPLRLRCGAINGLTIDEAAWEQKPGTSQYEESPTLWVRGGRIYDFHGDRGTIAEFENDLLVRKVEDDAACRTRRRDQGLMPFPFVALPLRPGQADDADDQAVDAREGPLRRRH